MRREDLARTLARETNQTTAAARDQIDELVCQVLKALKRGQPVELPGIGRLITESKREGK